MPPIRPANPTAWRVALPRSTTYPPGPERSSSAWRVAASAGRAPFPPSAFPLPRVKYTKPFTIGYSFRQTGQPTSPVRTMRPAISPVESTRGSGWCGSGQRSSSVSSMCIAAEDHPGEAVGVDAHALAPSLPVHHDRQRVVPGRYVADGEMLLVRRIGVRELAVGLDVGERRLLGLGLGQAVDAGLPGRLPAAVPHLPRDYARPRQRGDPQLRVRRVAGEPLARIHNEGHRVRRRDVDLEVQVVV